MSLPEAWIDKIFEKLVLVYGTDFMNRWRGIEVEKVKADWAHELAGLSQSPEAIKHALQHLPPGKPPTVLEFRDLARRVPLPTFQQLPPAKVSPGVLSAELKRIEQIRQTGSTSADPKAWARKLIARHEAGQPVRPRSLAMAREALRKPVSEEVGE